jgi:hypothetical protein
MNSNKENIYHFNYTENIVSNGKGKCIFNSQDWKKGVVWCGVIIVSVKDAASMFKVEGGSSIYRRNFHKSLSDCTE